MSTMKDYVNDHFRATHKLIHIEWRSADWQGQAPRIHCVDGFHFSVQASETHYSTPRENMAHPYTHVEIGYPSAEEPSIMEYAEEPNEPTNTVYAWVPVEVANSIIEAHGGIVVITKATP